MRKVKALVDEAPEARRITGEHNRYAGLSGDHRLITRRGKKKAVVAVGHTTPHPTIDRSRGRWRMRLPFVCGCPAHSGARLRRPFGGSPSAGWPSGMRLVYRLCCACSYDGSDTRWCLGAPRSHLERARSTNQTADLAYSATRYGSLPRLFHDPSGRHTGDDNSELVAHVTN